MNTTDWMRMLDQLDASLNDTLAESTRRAEEMADYSHARFDELDGSWQRVIDQLNERLRVHEGRIEQAERNSREAETALAEHENGVRQFVERVQMMHQQLAELPVAI